MTPIKRLLLLPALLITSSIINGEAIPSGSSEYFSLTAYAPVKSIPLPRPLSAANDACHALQEIDDIKKHLWWHEATSGTDTPEYYRLLARLSEIYVDMNPSSAEYHSHNKLYYLSLAKEAELRAPQDQQQKAWDAEEKAYIQDSAEWHEFKARIAGAMAEWYGKDTPEYTSCKNAQSICIANAKSIRQQKMRQEKHLKWQEEAKKYKEGSPEAYEFLARTEGEQATWYASGTAEYTRHKDNQDHYIQQAVAAKRKEEEAEQQRQQRISVGRSQRQNPNYRSVELIIRSVFEHVTLLATPTQDDLSEIMFYIPQDLKDKLYGRLMNGFSISFSANAVSKARARDWSAFSEIEVDFDLVELMPYEAEPQSAQHIFASPEIEQFLKSKLKSALKNLLDGKSDDLIDQNWSNIYKNFSPDDLNRVRRDLTEKGISAAVLDLSNGFNEEALQISLYNGIWEAVIMLVVNLKFIDCDAILEEWQKIYTPQLDPAPKRPFDPTAPCTDREVNAITVIARELELTSSEELLIKVASKIFTEARAHAIVDKILNPFEDTDEDE